MRPPVATSPMTSVLLKRSSLILRSSPWDVSKPKRSLIGSGCGPWRVDISEVIGADLQADGYTGRAKIVVDEDRKILLGATFVGPGVVDHLHAATIAVTAEVPLDRLWHAVPAFPTTSEVWLQLLEAYGL